MSSTHAFVRTFSLQEHATEQRRVHKQMLVKLRQQSLAQNQTQSQPSPPPEDATVTEDESLPPPTNTQNPSSDESDSHEEESDTSDLDVDVDNYYFLQPVPTRQRRALLRESGVRKIDSVEKDECREIRSSRESCGCSCKTYCDPDSCSCAQAGIKCQVKLALYNLIKLVQHSVFIRSVNKRLLCIQQLMHCILLSYRWIALVFHVGARRTDVAIRMEE